LDADGLEFATVDDGRDLARVAKAAARTLPFVLAAFDLDFVRRCHVVSLSIVAMIRLAAVLVTLPRPEEPLCKSVIGKLAVGVNHQPRTTNYQPGCINPGTAN